MEPPWGHLRGMLGPYEAILEVLGANLGSPGAILGTLWAILEPHGGLLEPPCGHLGASCSHLEASWAIWRPPGGDLGPILPHFGSIWTILAPFWHHFLRIPDQISGHKDCCVFMFVFCAVAFSRDFHYSKQKISCKKHTRNTCTHNVARRNARSV